MNEPLKNKIRSGKQLMNDNYDKYRNAELFTKEAVGIKIKW